VKDDMADGSSQGNWISAGNLKSGLKILMASGLLASVSELQAIDTFATVYNFEVEKTHTYYVGTEGVLVHNNYGIEALKKIRDALNTLSVDEWNKFQDLLINAKATTAERIAFYKYLANLDDLSLKNYFKEFVEGGLSLQRGLIKNGGPIIGTYTTKIKWGILDIDARPFGNKGYWGKRIAQTDARVEAFELKTNPNNESFYIEHPNGGFVQFENLNVNVLQDGKMVLQPEKSFYRVYDRLEFLRQKVLDEAIRQTQAASAKGMTVEWLVSDQIAVTQLTKFFIEKNINITVKFLAE
jgi:hypothetical protein